MSAYIEYAKMLGRGLTGLAHDLIEKLRHPAHQAVLKTWFIVWGAGVSFGASLCLPWPWNVAAIFALVASYMTINLVYRCAEVFFRIGRREALEKPNPAS